MNDIARVEELRSYQILDTLPEAEFNEIVELAAAICNTPASMITFIDADRQWYKAFVGVDFQQTPRELNFCEATFPNPNEVLVVSDMSKDIRFMNHPLVCNEPNARFYAGAPLQTPDGFVLGTLCVLDSVPREMTTQEVRALRLLSERVMKLLEMHKTVATQRESLETSAKLMKKLTDLAPAGIFQMEIKESSHLRFPFVSQGICALHPEFTPERMGRNGEYCFEHVHPDDVHDLRASLTEASATLTTWEAESRLVMPDGAVKWVRAIARPERRSDGEVIWYGIFQDMTDRRNYEDTLEQILWDISHVMRRPAVLMLGLVEAIETDHIDHQKLKEYARFFKDIAMSMDEYTQKLNDVYHLKRVQAKNKSEDDV
jgi:PAS domain-containing protein